MNPSRNHFDINKLLPMPIHEGTTGSVTGWEGQFTRGHGGVGKYKYSEMEWQNDEYGGGRGYSVKFQYKSQQKLPAPSTMPNTQISPKSNALVIRDGRHRHRHHSRQHKVRK